MFSPFEANKIIFVKTEIMLNTITTTISNYTPSAITNILTFIIYYINEFVLTFNEYTNYIFYDFFFILTNKVTCFFFFFSYILFYVSNYSTSKGYFRSLCYYALKYICNLVYGLVFSYLGNRGIYLFPFLSYVFLFLLFFNLSGLVPNAFPLTSHISITFSLSFIIWCATLFNSLYYRGWSYFSGLCLFGIPKTLVPIVICIELLSYFIRMFSLSLRLFANIVAGHILIHVFLTILNMLVFNFIFSISVFSITSSFIVIFLLIILICFETVIALIQSYVFIIITVLYVRDIFALTH